MSPIPSVLVQLYLSGIKPDSLMGVRGNAFCLRMDCVSTANTCTSSSFLSRAVFPTDLRMGMGCLKVPLQCVGGHRGRVYPHGRISIEQFSSAVQRQTPSGFFPEWLAFSPNGATLKTLPPGSWRCCIFEARLAYPRPLPSIGAAFSRLTGNCLSSELSFVPVRK